LAPQVFAESLDGGDRRVVAAQIEMQWYAAKLGESLRPADRE